ncbi:MAG TPA: HAD family hydrolase [Roseiflexaceae bacterium]|nr:HAD family hydrolase [Roseiflexaceae bacterium]HMP40839.1 HAD family hydrolase [Roseiflexaceae bacterium]
MIEVVRIPNGVAPRMAVIDFDGTLSLIRSGWQQIMATMMHEILAPLSSESAEALMQRIASAIEATTGRPTVEQMAWLTAEATTLGGSPSDAEHYKERYLATLDARITARLAALSSGLLTREELMLPGSLQLLAALHERGIAMALVSGTDRPNVVAEAAALGIDHYFAAGIFAPEPGNTSFAKHTVMAGLLATSNLPGTTLLAIGDGPVEIQAARELGGTTIGIAFDEERGSGIDPDRRALLIAAGADIIVPSYAGLSSLLAICGL